MTDKCKVAEAEGTNGECAGCRVCGRCDGDRPSWHDKAHRIIGELCFASWKQANHGRKRHVPYSVPSDAAALVECLGKNDEERAKAIFIARAMFGSADPFKG